MERGRVDARPTVLPITEIAIKLEPVKLYVEALLAAFLEHFIASKNIHTGYHYYNLTGLWELDGCL